MLILILFRTQAGFFDRFAEEKKEQEKQWKRMKLGFYMFGIGGVGFSAYSLYELAQPEFDADGELVLDEIEDVLTSCVCRQSNHRRVQRFTAI